MLWVTLILFVTCSVAERSRIVGEPEVLLRRSVAESFVSTTEAIRVPGVGTLSFRCEVCRVFYHASYFTAYMGLDFSRIPKVVVSVHACSESLGRFVPCAMERRGWPVSPAVLAAVDTAVVNWGAEFFVRRDDPRVNASVVPSGGRTNTAPHQPDRKSVV